MSRIQKVRSVLSVTSAVRILPSKTRIVVIVVRSETGACDADTKALSPCAEEFT
jgi:hypothetical protein